MKSLVILLFCVATHNLACAQDSLSVIRFDTLILNKPHSAKKATIMSAIMPGAGQIYNKKYWKAPIAWAGIGTCIYFINYNRKDFKLYKSELVKLQADPNYIVQVTNSTGIILNEEALVYNMNFSKKWLDLSYFSLVAVYGLNLLDANVDGHLFDYDISPDLSLRIAPTSIFSQSPKAGLSFTLNF